MVSDGLVWSDCTYEYIRWLVGISSSPMSKAHHSGDQPESLAKHSCAFVRAIIQLTCDGWTVSCTRCLEARRARCRQSSLSSDNFVTSRAVLKPCRILAFTCNLSRQESSSQTRETYRVKSTCIVTTGQPRTKRHLLKALMAWHSVLCRSASMSEVHTNTLAIVVVPVYLPSFHAMI